MFSIRSLIVVAAITTASETTAQVQFDVPKVTELWYPITIQCGMDPPARICVPGTSYSVAQANAQVTYSMCIFMADEGEIPPSGKPKQECEADQQIEAMGYGLVSPSANARDPRKVVAYVRFCFSDGRQKYFNGWGVDDCAAVRDAQATACIYAGLIHVRVCSYCVQSVRRPSCQQAAPCGCPAPSCCPTVSSGCCVQQPATCFPAHLSRRQIRKLMKRRR